MLAGNGYMYAFLKIYKEKFSKEHGELSGVVKNAFLTNARHLFVPDPFSEESILKDDTIPVMITLLNGKPYGSTISQPSFVLLILQVMKLEQKVGKILEIGSGCGWFAAMLSHLAEKVVGVEIFDLLCYFSRQKMVQQKIENVEIQKVNPKVRIGYPQDGPYDRIVASCAIPYKSVKEIVDQLSPSGIAVIPIQLATLPMEKIPQEIVSELGDTKPSDLAPEVALLFQIHKDFREWNYITHCQFVIAL